MPAYLIKGRHVICGAPHGAETRAIADGAVLVRDGVIAAVGKAEAPEPASVDTVLVAGELILDEGRIATLDEQGALTELAKSLSVLATDDERRLRELAKGLVPHVRAFYAGHLDGLDVEPHYAR